MEHCDDCPSTEVTSVFPRFGKFCADCAGTRALRPGGLPARPTPPGPVSITGPDGRTHRLDYRVQRYASGTGVELVEPGGGYRFSTISTLGRHDQPINAQVRHLRQVAEAAIGRLYLEPHDPDRRMLLAGNEAVGRLVWDGDADPVSRRPYHVVVDGREMSWEEFGKTLEPFEGWRFRLVIEDSIDEVHDSG